MSAADNADLRNGLQLVLGEIGRLKVDLLKTALRRFSDHCPSCSRPPLKMTGLKNELYNRCRDTVQKLYRENPREFWIARRIVSDIVTNAHQSLGSAHSQGKSYHQPLHHGYTNGAHPTSADYHSANTTSSYVTEFARKQLEFKAATDRANAQMAAVTAAKATGAGYNGYGHGQYGASSSSAPRPANGLPPPRFGSGAAAGPSGYNNGASPYGHQAPNVEAIPLRFRPNPFYRVDKSLSGVVAMPRAGEGDRKSVRTQFALTEPQRTLLSLAKASPSNPQYQVRLYCTSENYFNQVRPASTQLPAPIEFPSTCEVRLNSQLVPANTKGIKKQVGTAPPVDLGKSTALSLQSGSINTLELVYTNTEKVSKRYFMVVYLVQVTSTRTLVDRVKSGKLKSSDAVVQSIIKTNSDPDLEASSFGVSLKDPLTLARLKIPIRSETCTHISCFDAEVWFMINEQTPTWSCPICSKAVKVDDLIVDGFLTNILKICSSEVDGITVEPDGTWRSDDDKHGTAKPKSKAASRDVSQAREGSVKPDLSALNGDSMGDNGKGKSKLSEEALLLDSDDEDDDEPLAKRQKLNGVGGPPTISLGSSPVASPYAGNGSAGISGRRMDTIDLTLSDDDDDPPPPPVAKNAHAPPPPMPPARTNPYGPFGGSGTTPTPGNGFGTYAAPSFGFGSAASNGASTSSASAAGGSSSATAAPPPANASGLAPLTLPKSDSNSAAPPRPSDVEAERARLLARAEQRHQSELMRHRADNVDRGSGEDDDEVRRRERERDASSWATGGGGGGANGWEHEFGQRLY